MTPEEIIADAGMDHHEGWLLPMLKRAIAAETERFVEVVEGAMLWNMGVSARAVQARMVCRAIIKEIREPSAHDQSRKT